MRKLIFSILMLSFGLGCGPDVSPKRGGGGPAVGPGKNQAAGVDALLGFLGQVRGVLNSRLLTEDENDFLVQKLRAFRFELPDYSLDGLLEIPLARRSYFPDPVFELPEAYQFSRIEIFVWLVMKRAPDINGFPSHYSWSDRTEVASVIGEKAHSLAKNAGTDGGVAEYAPERTDPEIFLELPSFQLPGVLSLGTRRISFSVLNTNDSCCIPGSVIGLLRARSLRAEFLDAVKPLEALVAESLTQLAAERQNVFLYSARVDRLRSAFQKYRALLRD